VRTKFDIYVFIAISQYCYSGLPDSFDVSLLIQHRYENISVFNSNTDEWESEYFFFFFLEKKINPLKLNGRSLINLKDAFALFVILFMW
jgi:hypothetical protein